MKYLNKLDKFLEKITPYIDLVVLIFMVANLFLGNWQYGLVYGVIYLISQVQQLKTLIQNVRVPIDLTVDSNLTKAIVNTAILEAEKRAKEEEAKKENKE